MPEVNEVRWTAIQRDVETQAHLGGERDTPAWLSPTATPERMW